MTKEEAIKELEEDKALYMPKEWIENIDRDTPDGRLITALNMAIKALEKDLVLDKVRAEIKAIAINGQLDEYTMFMRAEEQVKQMSSEIIDKYRAESEDRNEDAGRF